jgi:hypothetical protein
MHKPELQIGNPWLNRSVGVVARMSGKLTAKLFSWKKAVAIVALGIGAISYRSYQVDQQKRHLDSVDLWVAAIAIFFCVVAFVVWWANREE